jgi:hypothetical protein
MTDTEDMELLERGPSLAMLADCAAEAGRDDGRLVMIGGEAGVGKTALLERFQRELPMPAGSGERATACSPLAPSDRCTTSPASSVARCWNSARAEPTGKSCSAHYCARPARPGR